MRTGRAWRVTEFDAQARGVTLSEEQFPDPQPGLVLVRVLAAGAGLPDLLMARGQFPGFDAPGFGLGEEVAGEVVAVAEGGRYQPGDRVMGITDFVHGRGGYADFAYIVEQSSVLAPGTLTDAEAAGFPIGFRTAWSALVQRTTVRDRETLLVLGAAGSTGSAAMQVGRALGLRVIAAASSPERRDFCLKFGADLVVDAREPDLPSALQAVAGAAGVDIVFDVVGGSTASAATSALNRNGRILIVGLASGSTVPLDSLSLLLKNHTAVGVYAGGYTPAEDAEAWSELAKLAAEGKIVTPVRSTWSFDEVPQMIRAHPTAAPGKSVVVLSA